MKNRSLIFIRAIGFFCAATIMILIFSMSSQNSQTSSATSAGVIEWLAGFLNPEFADMSALKQQEYIESFQFIIRKGAHFSAYCALSFFLSLANITFSKIKVISRLAFAFITTVVYAATDEFHQLFVVGRSAEVRDVLIDAGGALLGCLILYLIYLIYKKIRAFGK